MSCCILLCRTGHVLQKRLYVCARGSRVHVCAPLFGDILFLTWDLNVCVCVCVCSCAAGCRAALRCGDYMENFYRNALLRLHCDFSQWAWVLRVSFDHPCEPWHTHMICEFSDDSFRIFERTYFLQRICCAGDFPAVHLSLRAFVFRLPYSFRFFGLAVVFSLLLLS